MSETHFNLPVHFGEDKTTRDIYITSHAVDRWMQYCNAKQRDKAINAIRRNLSDSRPHKMDKMKKLFKSIRHSVKAVYSETDQYIFVVEGDRLVTLYPK